MGRSQRHRTLVQNYPADCRVGAEGALAPGYTRQTFPYTVPAGPAGGPLTGSSLAGPAPGALLTGLILLLPIIIGPNPPSTIERTYPVGPFNIAKVEQLAPGTLTYTLAEGADRILVGDTIRVEATGNSEVNGTYQVVTTDVTSFTVHNPVELAAPREAGRVTILSGA